MASPTPTASDKTPGIIVCDYVKELRDLQNASTANRDAFDTNVQAAKTTLGYKQCLLFETEQTFEFYRDLNNYELYDAQKSSEIIAADIGKYVALNEDLGKKIKDGSKALNELKALLLEANNLACNMHNCLKAEIGFGEHCGTQEPPSLTEVLKTAKLLSRQGQDAASAMVTIAGIQTFSNLSTLKPYAADLVAAYKDLKKDTDGYITAADTDLKAVQTELSKVIDELNTQEFNELEETSILHSIDEMIDFLCKGSCEPISTVEDICKEVSTCADPDKPNGGDCGGSKYMKKND